MYQPASCHSLGLGAWETSGRFSVGDLKSKIPPQEIRDKGNILAMVAGWYWEEAAKSGFQSTYVGMLDANDQIVDVQTLLDRGEYSNILVMKLARTPHDLNKEGMLTEESLEEFHRETAAGRISAYIADAECIFRWGFPLGSSTFKKIFNAAGIGNIYERFATYKEIVTGLDQIRQIPGILELPEMANVLREAGLEHIPNPGYTLSKPVIGFTTKFNPAGDKDLSHTEAQLQMHLDDLRFTAWQATLEANARHQRKVCLERGIVNIDGKTEALVVNGFPVFTDFACTMDENRLMIKYAEPDNKTVRLIPANKEIQRAVFRTFGIYQAKEAAVYNHGDDWLDYINQYVTDREIADATTEAVWMMEQAISTVGNLLLGKDIFEAKSIDKWVGRFLPYASSIY